MRHIVTTQSTHAYRLYNFFDHIVYKQPNHVIYSEIKKNAIFLCNSSYVHVFTFKIRNVKKNYTLENISVYNQHYYNMSRKCLCKRIPASL